MNLRNLSLLAIGGIIVLLYILPFVIFTQYTHLGTDDLCRTNSSFYNFFEGVLSWYTNHNGRYVNSLFSLLPVYDLQTYRWVLTISMFAFFIVIYFFVKYILLFFGHSSGRESLNVSLVFIVVLLSELPSLYELFYWYAGTTVYLFSSIFLLLLLDTLYKTSLGNKKATLASGILIILVTGSTEMYIPLVSFILVVLFLKTAHETKRFPWKFFALNIVCLISALAVFLSPGSEKRQSIFSESGQIIHSLTNSVDTALKISWNRFNDLTVWMFLLVIFLISFFNQKDLKEKIKVFNPIFLFLLSAIAFISVIYVPFFALGFLDYSAGRIMDCIYLTFFLLLFINYINIINYIVSYINLHNFISFEMVRILTPFVLAGFLITVTLTSQNYKGMYEDLANKSFKRFDDEVTGRYELLENSVNDTVVIVPVKNTKILTFDENIFGSECFIQHVRLNYNSNIKEIIVQ